MANEQIAMGGSIRPQTINPTLAMNNEAVLEQNQVAAQEAQQKQFQYQNDQMALKDYLKQGNTLATPDDWDKAMSHLSDRVSPDTYLALADKRRQMKVADAQFNESVANMDAATLTHWDTSQKFVDEAVSPVFEKYDTAKKQALASGRTHEDAERLANESYKAALQPALQALAQIKDPMGKPAISPQQLQAYASAPYEQAKTIFEHGKYNRAIIDDQLKKRQEAAKAEQDAAAAEKNIQEARKFKIEADAILANGGVDPSKEPEAVKEVHAMGLDPKTGKGKEMLAKLMEHKSEFRPTINLQTGANVPEGSGESKLPPELRTDPIEVATWDYIVNKKDPPKRGNMYKETMTRVGQVARENNMTVEELIFASADVHSQLLAKVQLEKRAQNMQRAENQLKLEIPVMQDAMKALDPSRFPALAKAEIWALRQAGDPRVTKLDQAAETIFNEFEGIKTGNPGALNVQDVVAAKEAYQNAKTPQQLQAAVEGMNRIINNAGKALELTRKETMEAAKKAFHPNRGGASEGPAPALGAPQGSGGVKATGIASKAALEAAIKAGTLKSGDTFTDVNGVAHKVK